MKSWLPWKMLLRRAALRRGFVDPVAFLARMRQFAQPSEVQEPIELIRAGVLFHARGLINTKVLQNNLDWVWPFWVVRQFDPRDRAFLPRSFSISHVNLTHRNWTAVGLPDLDRYPIVDPHGLVTPFHDGWSLDWWFIPDDGAPLFPSKARTADQVLDFGRGLEVVTRLVDSSATLKSSARVEHERTSSGSAPVLHLEAGLTSTVGGKLVLALRPANPEGTSFIDEVRIAENSFIVDERATVSLDRKPDAWAISNYVDGDLSHRTDVEAAPDSVMRCPAGLASVGAIFQVTANAPLTVDATIDLTIDGFAAPSGADATSLWNDALAGTPALNIPDERWKFLYQSALRTLVLLSPGEIFPGPYTYRRFWFRDACLMMQALLALNLDQRVRRALDRFPERQRHDGYFHSQEGEWDANGEVLWIINRVERTTGRLSSRALLRAVEKGARWIVAKRGTTSGKNHKGLLPPGFSAEHLGPNDYYYWDDFWGVAGLEAAADILARRGETRAALETRDEARAFAADLQRSLDQIPQAIRDLGVPASPYRRMDAGAIGSLVADYPLQLDAFGSHRFVGTADWLWTHSRHRGGFFQDMIHSGVNAYLSLALAQTFLRHGDTRYLGLIHAVADTASPTGNWPEAIHPQTGGGCMGDGQHGWAAAEWVMMMRAIFVREERDHLVIGSGVPESWIREGEGFEFGPTNTLWGPVTVRFKRHATYWGISIVGVWHGATPSVRIAVPGFETLDLPAPNSEVRLTRCDEQAKASSLSFPVKHGRLEQA